ncbi:nocturnin isoform X2 [Schistocerca gregaria]|uniref:nocturnin isoform X2 n=1 Tax=Schistocerca gregaria TaxID=7010 RepID=UPI00211E6570|nr:nocturnin isoform X2 [Schistocerca gregaria]
MSLLLQARPACALAARWVPTAVAAPAAAAPTASVAATCSCSCRRTVTTAASAAPAQAPLALPRMGSFTSAPKILNEDTQDSDVQLPERLPREELLERCRQQVAPLPALLKRRFRRLGWSPDPQAFEEPVNNPDCIRVFQWNVLSQSLGQTNDNFVCCPDDALEWHRRRYHIAEEIVQYCPDVICLQEVDHFSFLTKVLGSQGYSGIFYPKPDSPCLYIKGNNGPDGCAIFYRREKFELLQSDSRVLEVWRVQSNQVAVAVVLRVRETGREVCVATTHLKARQGALLSTLRNEQGRDLVQFVRARAAGRPVLLCGDFNAEPSEPVYATVRSCPHMRLASAYADGADDGREPAYTTWKVREEGEVCHTIDYVFYSSDALRVEALLDFPSGDEIGEGRVPSFAYPSDHFSLVCDFRFAHADAGAAAES